MTGSSTAQHQPATGTVHVRSALFLLRVRRQEMRCGAPQALKSPRSRCHTGRRRQTVWWKRLVGSGRKSIPSQRGSRTFPRRLGVCVASRGAHARGDENLRGGDNRYASRATCVSRRVQLSAAGCTRSKKIVFYGTYHRGFKTSSAVTHSVNPGSYTVMHANTT